MSVNDFLTKQNVELLWEVITDDELLKNKPNELINQVANMFTKNVRLFNEAEKNKFTNLMSMNKKFIVLMLNRSHSIISNSNPLPIQKTKELITSTDLQSERMSQFEKDLSQKQSEFTNAMSLQVPPVPKFSDNNIDEPIGEMELEIKKVLQQRKYDIEQVNKTLNNSNSDTWLKSQETSIKNEKLVSSLNKNNSNQDTNINNTNSLKYIKINNENIENSVIKKDIIDLNQKKHISWKDELENENENENENIFLKIVDKEDNLENNIFKKLKKINPEINDSSTNINSRMNILEDKINGLNNKMDLILQLLNKNDI